VERAIGYARQSFWPLREFTDLHDVNRQVRQWLSEVANQRQHRTTNEVPQLRFDRDERNFLKPLARTSYPRLHGVTVNPTAPKPTYTVDVQRRPLSVYAEAVR